MSLRIYSMNRVWYAENSAMNRRAFYDCDMLADMPATAGVGEKCYCAETNITYQWDGDSWESSAGGGITAEEDIDAVYPVGSIYTSIVSTNPGTVFGVGTWVEFGAGRVLVGVDSADTDFDTVEETGGSKTHTLTVDEIPAHVHDEYTNQNTTGGLVGWGSARDTSTNNATLTDYDTGSTGGGQAHANMPPYLTVYFWKRTA